MATNNTDFENNADMTENEEVISKPGRKAAPKTDTKDAEIAELKAQIAMLMSMMANNRNGSPEEKNSLLDEVTVVHLVERAPGLTTHIELKTTTLDMAKFGEQRTLDRRQAEELAGKYRSFFEKGIISFGAGNEEFAERCGLKTVKSYKYMTPDFVDKLGTLEVKDLEKLYKTVDAGHKAFILEYFQRKAIEGDPAFKNSVKIEALNRLSNNAMSGVALDLQTENE